MNRFTITRGSTSQTIEFDVFDSSSTTGARLAGIAYGDITAYYYRQNAAGETAITLATMTLGTWSSGGFIVIDATNMPGHYQLSIPDATLATASGVDRVTIELKGATNMVPVTLSIDLVDSVTIGTDGKLLLSTDAQDLSATLDTNAKNIGGTAQTGNDIGADADAILAMLDNARAEPGQGAPAVNADAMTKLDYLYKAWRNKTEQTATTLSIYDDAGTTVDQKVTVSDDTTTATHGEVVSGP